MLEQFNKKQKILIIIIIGIIVIVVGIYGFITMSKNETILNLNEIVLQENNQLNNQSNNQSDNKKLDNQEQSNEVQKDANYIVVHITGEIKNSGILKLPEGARIADAVEAAGGATKEADLETINLAYILEDGQKIYIPNKEENNEQKQYITKESGDTINEKETSSEKGENKKVNINTANQSELETLPGIGPSLASRIMEYREQNGKFNNIEELKNVKGIGDTRYEELKALVEI